MSRIIPKLNLNKTPQLVENNSLVYAKNIKLSDDGVISPDTSLSPIYNPDINNSDINNIKYKGHIVGLNNIVYIFKEDTTIDDPKITNSNDKVKIFKYNEITKDETIVECAWKYSGGKIDGLVTTNNIGDEILTICEYDVVGINIPIKHINLNKCKDDTEESIYTQNPNVLLSNILNITPVEGMQIPNGVYQFFIRYEIRKDFYTNWIPCSKDIYVGKNQQNCTIQGSIRYVDTNYDSPTSFRFEIEHILDNINFYEKFQLGFILSSNDSVVARSWKHFNLYKEKRIITFDYDKASIEEINIDDLLQTNYEIFNVKNITYFKNKEYISNYVETNFNKTVDTKDIKITLRKQNIDYKINTNNTNVPIDSIQQIDYKDINDPTENKELINIIINKHEEDNYWGSIMRITNITINDINNNDINNNDSNINYDLSYVYSYSDRKGHQSFIHVNYNNTKITENNTTLQSTKYFNDIIPRAYSLFVAGKTANYFAGVWEDNGGDGDGTYKSYDNIRFDDNSNMSILEAIDKWVFLLKKHYKETYGDCIIDSIIVNDLDLNKNVFTDNSKYIIKSENLKQKIIDVLTENKIELNQYSEITVKYNLLIFENYKKNEETIGTIYPFDKISISLEAKQDTKEIKYIAPLLQNNEIEINRDIINYTTLMPKVNYEFYIHFVKRNGIITNGIKINNISNDIKINNVTDLTNLPYYPTYTNKNELAIIYPDISINGDLKDIAPKDAVAWFISIYNPTNITCRGFNFRQDNEYNYIECIEVDSLLHNLIDNISIYKQYENQEFILTSTKGEYLSSSQTKVIDYFGNTGVIRWPIDPNESLTTFTNISSTIKIPIINNKISGYIRFNTNKHTKIYNKNFAGNINTVTNNIINTIEEEIINSIPEKYRNNFDIVIDFPDTTLPIIYDKENGLLINDNEIVVDSFYNINNNKITLVNNIVEINEDEYNSNLKQLEIYNTTINTTRLATEVNSNTITVQGTLNGQKLCPIKPIDSNIELIDNEQCIDNSLVKLLNINVGSADASIIADASSNTIKEINSIKNNIDKYNINLSNAKDANVVKYIKNGKTTYSTKEGIVSGKELLSLINCVSITVSTKADENGDNPISFIDFAYSRNQKTKDNIINPETKKFIINGVFATSTDYSYWIMNNVSNSTINDENKKLTKITPFIKIDKSDSAPTKIKYDDYKNMNLPAFLCLVEKPDYNINNKIYISGTDVYNKTYFLNSENETDDENNNIDLPKELNKGVFKLEKYEGYIPYRISNLQATISNFNLNMLSLREDLTLQVRSSSEIDYDEDGKEKETIYTQTFKAINSLVVSSIYQLPTMYKDYIRKYYYITNEEDNIYKFDNTVRSSNVNVDESHINVYRFKAEDYYHVPANKGFIVKMFTILDNIYIHCQHALYNFVGANSLTSVEGNVALKETDVFDNGIKALLDSKNGFAGISEKHHGLVTYSSYIWYDYLAKTIYSIDSQTGIKNISQSIRKLINNHNITDVTFVADENNTRFFVNFKINNDSICLSYDFRNKDFISLHDLDFKEGFNTRSNTYLVSNVDESQTNTIYQLVPYIEYKDADNSIIQDFIRYEKCYKQNLILGFDDKLIDNSKGLVSASFDVICNDNYEIIKSLEYINWICGKIIKFNDDVNFAEEHIDYTYPANYCRIYNELTKTDLINLSSRSNDANLNQDNNIIKPRFNKGIWSLNYFRNINDNNIDRNNDVKLNYHIEDSLLYGKYFVVRFVFNNTNFKFENITFNVNIYE